MRRTMRSSDRPRPWNFVVLALVLFVVEGVARAAPGDKVTPDSVDYKVGNSVVRFLTFSLLGASIEFAVGDYQGRREDTR
jgi:hypothetical protein